jgi:glutathionylspermidine synthase
MITLKKMPQHPENSLRSVGWDWMLGADTLPYLVEEAVVISEDEANAYYEAGQSLYEMFIEAGQYAIDHNLFKGRDSEAFLGGRPKRASVWAF